MKIVFKISPQPKSRLTQRDQWKERPAVSRYFAFRDHVKYLVRMKGLQGIPGAIECITFFVAMPQSWSIKKQAEMNGKPHQQVPDLDNYLKGFLDALCIEDKHIHYIGNLQKVWAEAGSIEMTLPENCEQMPEQIGTDVYKYL